MLYEWDERKAAVNSVKHGVAFEAIHRFDWATAQFTVDDRNDYGELRINAIGFIGARLHVVTYAPRGRKYRIISLRKANGREQQSYVEAET
jgi:hypothetical protein